MALLTLVVAACNRSGETPAPASSTSAASGAVTAGAASAPGSAASAPPVGVTTVPARLKDLPVQLAATGTVSSLASVEVRPQLTSVVTRVHIREGQFVRAGEAMFTLDARTDEANVAKALAQVAKDEASLADARRQLARSRDLLAQNFISQNAVDANQTQVDAQSALVAADKAAVDAARVGLSYARINAPRAGRVGAINVYAGSSVQANQTALATITQLDPIAVTFSLPQRELGNALAALPGGGAPVAAVLPEGAGTLQGRLQFVDNAVDAASGTVKSRAVFDNREGKLWPGAYVNVSMTVQTLKDAVVVPQAAIIQSARGPIVYTVKDGVAQPRPLVVVHVQGDDAAVTGVRAGERIVLDGRQNLRPGSAVVERPREGGGGPRGAGGPGAAGGGAASGAGRAASAGAAGAGATTGSAAPERSASGPARASASAPKP